MEERIVLKTSQLYYTTTKVVFADKVVFTELCIEFNWIGWWQIYLEGAERIGDTLYPNSRESLNIQTFNQGG